jgi:Fe-Mn family superoxide dismutase
MIYLVAPLTYKKLEGLSEKQLASHHDVLYAGYVKKLNEINDKLANLEHRAGNATYTDYRELKIEKSFAENGVILHELYFENLGGKGELSKTMIAKLEESFGSYQDFEIELIEAGLSARGWVILGKKPDGQLEFYLCDAHNMNAVWGVKPILVLDVYEHAYFVDYATNRKSYLESFLKLINWDVVEKRLS